MSFDVWHAKIRALREDFERAFRELTELEADMRANDSTSARQKHSINPPFIRLIDHATPLQIEQVIAESPDGTPILLSCRSAPTADLIIVYLLSEDSCVWVQLNTSFIPTYLALVQGMKSISAFFDEWPAVGLSCAEPAQTALSELLPADVYVLNKRLVRAAPCEGWRWRNVGETLTQGDWTCGGLIFNSDATVSIEAPNEWLTRWNPRVPNDVEVIL